MNQPTVFFVDDEKNVLDGLRRVLRRKVRNWDTYYLNSGPEALAKMKEVKCDVIVSDMRMPGMDGAQLLKEVTEQHPDTIRFILSGQSDEDAIERAVAYTHQFLAKPCEVKLLLDLITAALEQRDVLNNENLRSIVTKINSLPSLPSIYQELRECVDNESPISEAVRLISQDVAMTAKVMQLVNSSFFGLSNHISSIPQNIVAKRFSTGGLSDEEHQQFQEYVEAGYRMISPIQGLERVSQIVKHQQKTYSELKSTESEEMEEGVSIGSRILKTLIDYDELKRNSMKHVEIIEMFRRSAHYDPDIVTVCDISLYEDEIGESITEVQQEQVEQSKEDSHV